MDLRQLRYVVAVVDHGGFTRAARAVHVAQPSLSQAVRALEAELGTDLFQRGRTVRLTAAGEALLEPARQALRDVDTARAAVANVVGLRAGHLDVVSLPTLAVHPAAEVIGSFRRAHPAVTVRLHEPEDAAAVASRVRDGSSEIGFAELPLASADLVAHRLDVQEFVALLPDELDARLPGGTRLSIAALADQPLITTPSGTSTRRQLDDHLSDAGLRATIAVETDHREAIAALVTAGAGVAIVPSEVAADLATPEVRTRRIAPTVTREVGIVHRSGALSPAATRFLEIALEDRDRSRRPAPGGQRKGLAVRADGVGEGSR